MSMFAAPSAPSGGIEWKEYLGSLLLIEVLAIETDVQTVHGKSDPARVNINVLDGAGKGDEYPDALVFPKVLTSQLRRSVGQKVLGRLGQGEKKPGQSPPWILQEASAQDVQLAEEWIKNNQQPSTQAPAAPF